MIKVAIGSNNPVKIDAVTHAFQMVWPDKEFEFVGIDVDSGVSPQPMSDEESIKGAKNRAIRAREKVQADYGVGLEGGLQETEGLWLNCGWIAVVDKTGKEGIGATIKLEVSPREMKHIHEGKELGEVNDLMFHKTNSKQDMGHFGLMTNGALPRMRAYTDGVISALVRFIHPNLWES